MTSYQCLFSSREVVLLSASLSTCDPGDVFQTVEAAVAARVRCTVIALAAQMHLLKHLAYVTGGTSHVVLDEPHFKELLFAVTLPPPAKVRLCCRQQCT